MESGYRCAAERFWASPGQSKYWLKIGPITRAKTIFQISYTIEDMDSENKDMENTKGLDKSYP